LGANGQGKSTLVKTIAREMKALAGKVTEGKGLNIGYFAQQELDVLRPGENPLEHMVRLAKELGAAAPAASREQDLRNWLGTFNFSGDMVKQSVGSMSGGEKARLVLAMIVWQRPNLLLLDEPTNHLDLATREALAMALNDFDGTVMLVSHDRHLLRAVCEDFWLVGRGKVGPFDGDLDDYQRYLLDESKRLREEARAADHGTHGHQAEPVQAPVAAAPAPVASKPETLTDPKEARRQAAAARQQLADKTKPFKKELEQIDKKLPQLNAERSALEEKLATPGLAGADIVEAGKQLSAVNSSIEQLEERWLELSEQIEAIAQELGATA
jgi:ATP-binding cassette subfamily F protein 3